MIESDHAGADLLVAGSNVYTAVITDPFGRQATNVVAVVAQGCGYGYDANGNMTNDGQFAYVWDNADRLVEVRRGSQVVMTCRYDGLGRRRERIVTAGYEGGPSTNRYVYHGWQVLEVRDGGNAALESYVHGPDLSGTLAGAGGIGGIVSCSTGGTNRWFHYDGNGNVARVTDGSRGVVSALEYAPFGAVLLRSGTYTPRHAFSSKEWDAAVGLSYYGYRYYSPYLGRWLSRDPIEDATAAQVINPRSLWRVAQHDRAGAASGSLVFAGNCPEGQIDPLGLEYSKQTLTCIACACGVRALELYHIVEESSRAANDRFHGGQKEYEPEANAYRHCIGSCGAMRGVGPLCAIAAELCHEANDGKDDPLVDHVADAKNNGVGNSLARRAGSCEDNCMEAMRQDKLDCKGRKCDPAKAKW